MTEEQSNFAIFLIQFIDKESIKTDIRSRASWLVNHLSGYTLSERLVNYWLSSQQFPGPKWGAILKNKLEISDDLWARMKENWNAVHEPRRRSRRSEYTTEYKVQGFREAMQERQLSIEELSRDLSRICKEFPSPDGVGWEGRNGGGDDYEYGPIEKWCEIYNLSPDTGALLVHRDEGVVGYWYVVPVEERFYERILEGENINHEIRTDHVRRFIDPGEYSVYFVDLFILPKHRQIKAEQRLFDRFGRMLENYAVAGIFVRRIAATITSGAAKNLCERRGFKPGTLHKVHRRCFYDFDMENIKAGRSIDSNRIIPAQIYELKIWESDVFKGRIFENRQRLVKNYMNHFQWKDG